MYLLTAICPVLCIDSIMIYATTIGCKEVTLIRIDRIVIAPLYKRAYLRTEAISGSILSKTCSNGGSIALRSQEIYEVEIKSKNVVAVVFQIQITRDSNYNS